MKRALAAALCALIVAGCEQVSTLRVAWAPEEPGAEISHLLATLFANDFRVIEMQMSSHTEVIDALRNNTVDLAIIEQPGQPVPGVMAVAHMFPSVLHVLVKGCPPETTLASAMTLGSVYAGPVGSAAHRLVKNLAEAGVIPEISRMNLLDSPFGAEPDVLVVFGGILSADARNRLQGYCLLSLGDPARLGQGDWVEGVAYRFPQLRPFILPAGLYPELTAEATLTLAVSSTLVTRADLDAEIAYSVAQIVDQHRAELEQIYPLAGDAESASVSVAASRLPLHPGAERYLQRDAPSFLERYAEALAFLITAVVAISSGGLALMRVRRQAHKDRLDVYFARVMELRGGLFDEEAGGEVEAELIALQAEVTQLVVEESLPADASLVAFYTFSNRVLEEAQLAGIGDGGVRRDG